MFNNININLGNLPEAAKMLIEKVSNAVGKVYQPTHIKRIAQAEVEAEKIKVIGGQEITEIQQRGLERIIYQEGRKQANIEQITAQAAQLLPKDAEVEGLDEDWVAHFFKQCDTVSDNEMQSMWAQLLSGEAAHPGTFSKRTVNLVSSLDKKDAALFTSFCQFNWVFNERKDIMPLVYEIEDDLYKKQGIDYISLKHLDAVGLISLNNGRMETAGYDKFAEFFYYDRLAIIEFPKKTDNTLSMGHAMLTEAGKQLAPICGSKPNHDVFEYVIKIWSKFGLQVQVANDDKLLTEQSR